jgi:hypothetical protein
MLDNARDRARKGRTAMPRNEKAMKPEDLTRLFV